jgi:predicted GH43/DUF377 family glycosyl hydrolase
MLKKINSSFFIKMQLFFFVPILFFLFFNFSSLKRFNKDRPVYRRFFDKDEDDKGKQSLSKIVLNKKFLKPSILKGQDLVVKTKKVNIRNVLAPYNASFIPYGSGYLIFFRYDIKHKSKFVSYIGCAELDANFDQTNKEFIKIDTQNENSEDPRVLCTEKETYLIYTKVKFKKEAYVSTINIAAIDLQNYKLKFKTKLDPQFSFQEKNWVPFEYKGQIYFQYSLNPQKILLLPDPQKNHLELFIDNIFRFIPWDNRRTGWGSLRGGSPALNIGNKYLAFFHSSFVDEEGLFWYSMGAYTFENQPPFRITAISPSPILFSDIYDTVPLNTSDVKKCVIFPSSFVIEQKDGKEWIHLSCGENDASIKIVTLDKDALIKGLKKIS